jgi:hypothetical protein
MHTTWMVEVVATDEFQAWYEGLGESQRDEVDFLVGLLEQKGVTLGHPYSSALKGAEGPLRELRGTSGKAELRVVYAFNPRREGVLLVGGDKSGDSRFYERIIQEADKIWREYLREQGFKKPQK